MTTEELDAIRAFEAEKAIWMAKPYRPALDSSIHDIPKLLDEIERLRKELERLKMPNPNEYRPYQYWPA